MPDGLVSFPVSGSSDPRDVYGYAGLVSLETSGYAVLVVLPSLPVPQKAGR